MCITLYPILLQESRTAARKLHELGPDKLDEQWLSSSSSGTLIKAIAYISISTIAWCGHVNVTFKHVMTTHLLFPIFSLISH